MSPQCKKCYVFLFSSASLSTQNFPEDYVTTGESPYRNWPTAHCLVRAKSIRQVAKYALATFCETMKMPLSDTATIGKTLFLLILNSVPSVWRFL